MRRLSLVLVLVAGCVFAACRPAPAPAPSGVNWDAVAQCETGGNWQMSGPVYSGGLGFANSSFAYYSAKAVSDGRALFIAPDASVNSREVQIIVAEEIREANGGVLRGAWGCWRAGGVG